MRIEPQNSNAGLIDTKIFTKRVLHYFQLGFNFFFRDSSRYLIYRDMLCYQTYPQCIAYHEHQTFLCTKKLSEVFCVTGEWKFVTMYRMLVDWCRYQCINNSFFQFFAGLL